MIGFTMDIFVVMIYWLSYIWLKQGGFDINFKSDDTVVKAVFKKIVETYSKNEKLTRTINLSLNIIMKLNLAILVNVLVYYAVLFMSGNNKENKWAIIILGSLISIAIDYILLIILERDLDTVEYAISKNFIDALMQLSVVITLIAGLINLKLSQINGSTLVIILYVFPALISYKYQLKVFDKHNENEED